MADEYSYPQVLQLSYDQIDAMDIPYIEKQNIKLRKLANVDYDANQRRALVDSMAQLFTKPGSNPKNARDTVGRWLSPNPGKVRRDFYTGQGSGSTFPQSYDATEKYQSGEKADTPIPGRRYGEKKLTPKQSMELRDKFIKGITQQEQIKSPTKRDRTFNTLDGKLEKDRVIQYLRSDSLWHKDLKLKISISTSDGSFQIEFDDYTGESESSEGLKADLFEGIQYE